MHAEDSPHSRTDGDDLWRRRRDLERGLRRSRTAVRAAVAVAGLLTVMALWLGAEADHRARDAVAASERLWESSVDAARLQQTVRRPGQRRKSLAIIAEAARLRPSRELRDAALSAALLPDIGPDQITRPVPDFRFAIAGSSDSTHFVENSDRRRAILRRWSDGAVVMNEAGLGSGTRFSCFSPDDRFVAITFHEGQVGLWEWRTGRLAARFVTCPGEWGQSTCGFGADGRHFWWLTPTNTLAAARLENFEPDGELRPGTGASLLRLDPSGGLAAVAVAGGLEVWDLSTRSRRAHLSVTGGIRSLAWHPAEARTALVTDGLDLLIWDVSEPQARRLGPAGPVLGLFFLPPGDLLCAGPAIWDLRSGEKVLSTTPRLPLEVSRDGTRLTWFEDRVGEGEYAWLPPVGLRAWPAPASLGGAIWSADMDRAERSILTAHQGGWLIRDAATGRELTRMPCGETRAVSFGRTDAEVLAWTREGLLRWDRVDPDHGAVTPPVLLSDLPAMPQEPCCFSADRRRTTVCRNGWVTVIQLDGTAPPRRFRLDRPADSTHCLSPDGRWLVTGRHNQSGLDWYDLRSGRRIRRVAEEGFAAPTWDPGSGSLRTWTATHHTRWDAETGRPDTPVPFRRPVAYQGFVAFDPHRPLAAVTVPPAGLDLVDGASGRDIASLDFRDPVAVFGGRWSADGQRLHLFHTDGSLSRVELPPLREELRRLGLDWSDDAPTRGFAAAAARPAPGYGDRTRLALVVVMAGLVATIGIGARVLAYQRRLFGNWLATEALAARRAEELRRTQSALLHSEKMKALGTFAAGVAHDFNNLLSIVRLSSELIEEQTANDEVVRGNFDAIRQAVRRGKGIVDSMLGYARDDGCRHRFRPADLIGETVALLTRPFLSGLVLRIDTPPATPELTARKGRLEQMLLNLIVNAAEAMNGRGTLTLRTGAVDRPGPLLLAAREAPGYVEFAVEDSGPGIPPDLLPRIFEPFFTTRTSGPRRGSGLGLSMLYTIASEEGIGVAVESRVGLGTTFRLLVPVEPDPTGGTCRLPDTLHPESP